MNEKELTDLEEILYKIKQRRDEVQRKRDFLYQHDFMFEASIYHKIRKELDAVVLDLEIFLDGIER